MHFSAVRDVFRSKHFSTAEMNVVFAWSVCGVRCLSCFLEQEIVVAAALGRTFQARSW